MVDFFYHGEANVHQENLGSFLVLAEELQLKGLRGNQADKYEEVYQEQAATQRLQQRSHNSRPASTKNTTNKNISLENGLAVLGENEKALALWDHTTNCPEVESLDRQIKSLMTVGKNADPYRKWNGRRRYARCVKRRD